MKFVKYGFYLLTLICCGVAVWMQVSVSGDNLLTMDTGMGYMLAVSYRWVTLAAVILVVLSLMIFAISRLRRKKTEGKKPGKKEKAAAQPAAPAPAPAVRPAAPAGGFCSYCGSRVAAGKRFCPNCGRPIEP